MIYNNSSVKLYGEVADNFLESVGVNIFDDGDIAIGESIYDLSTGCDILEENGVILCEDCIVLEGKQAEEYKARKAKEKEDRERERVIGSPREFNKYASRKNDPQHADSYRFATDTIDKRKRAYYDASDKMANYGNLTRNRMDNVSTKRHRELVNDAISKGKHYTNAMNQTHVIADTYGRHKRRHPKQYKESTIFSNIEII